MNILYRIFYAHIPNTKILGCQNPYYVTYTYNSYKTCSLESEWEADSLFVSYNFISKNDQGT